MSGRYRLPDPKCTHKRKGRVEAGDPQAAFASTNVCDRPECIADAREWATAMTHEPAHYRPDSDAHPALQGQLL